MIKQERKKVSTRQLLMVLPVLVIALLAGVFHALGGGSGGKANAARLGNGINTSLPDAQFAGVEPADKMGYYDRAVRDSAQLESKGLELAAQKLGFDSGHEDPMVLEVNDKLAALNSELAKPYVAPSGYSGIGAGAKPPLVSADPGMGKDVAKLEALMKNLKDGSGGGDPEMSQLSEMMDKLIAVQNPELAKALYKKPETQLKPDSLFAAIPAEIAAAQKARQGSVVELRLLDTVVLSGVVVPKGHLIYGLAGFSNQRLNLEIKNIRLGNRVIPVNLTVYDKRDAMAGINAPEALLTEAVGAGATDAMGSVGISGFDLTTQIAEAGIDAARSLLSKKIKRVCQNLKPGYPLLIRDNSKKER
jgi:hypothetical protein